MSKYIVDGTELTSVANAIRTKGGTNSPLVFPNGFVSAVNNISGGGGGSSDFSTATMTIVNEGATNINLIFATVNERGFSLGGYTDYIEQNSELPVVLYKGGAVLSIDGVSSDKINITGDIENTGGTNYGISGDCTITIVSSGD